MTKLLKRHDIEVIINCASSIDGKIALPSKKQTKISCEEDMKRVHVLRNSVDAILVGIGTIINDNPKLTVKEEFVKNAKNPIRVVIDSQCRIPLNSYALDGKAKTIIFCTEGNKKKLKNAEVIVCGKEKVDLRKMLKILKEKGVKKLLVEGGSTVIWEFLKEKLANELNVFVGSVVIGGKNSPTIADGEGVKNFEEIIKLKLISVKKLGDGVLLRYMVEK